MAKLTAKQIRFVQEYSVDLNGAQAAMRAGYAPRSARVTASRLLTNANIRRAVEALQRAAVKRIGITRERVLDELQSAVQLARGQGDVSGMIRGWVEIAKILGLHSPERKSVEVSVSSKRVLSQLEMLTDSELLEIVENDDV